MPKEKKAEEVQNTTFSKDELLRADKYRDKRDLLAAVLKDGERYTHAQASTRINEYLKGTVK